MFKSHPTHIYFFVLSVFIGSWFVAEPVRAESVYTVRDVAVDASSTSAAEARSVALAEGHLMAFERLIRRLVLAEDQVLLPLLESSKIAVLTEGFVINKELVSPTRYRASLTLDFNKNAVRNLLRERQIRFAETRSSNIVVLPVFDAGDGPILWLEPGDWRSAWLERPTDDGLVSMILPLGDVIDMASIDALQASKLARDPLLALAHRYGAQEIVVASAYLRLTKSSPQEDKIDSGSTQGRLVEGEGSDLSESRRIQGEVEGAILELMIHRVGAADEQTSLESLRGGADEALKDFLARAVERVLKQVEGFWKQENVLRFSRENRLSMLVPLNSLPDWVEIRRRLSQLAVMVSVDLNSLSRDRAEVTIKYFGETEQLLLSLQQSDFALNFESRGWVLQTDGASRQSESGEKVL